MIARGGFWLALGAGVCLGAGFLLGRAGSGATEAERSARDSLKAVSARLDAAIRENDSLATAVNRASQATVAAAAARIQPARAGTNVAIRTVLELVPDTGAIRRAVDALRDSLGKERRADSAAIVALAADTLQKSGQILTLLGERRHLQQQRDAVQVQLDAALRRRTEPNVTLGATGGWGPQLSGGRLRTGWGATVGLTIRIPVRLPLLGG